MSEQRSDLPPGTILGMMLNENARLRAELAAEKEDVWKMRDVGLRAITGAIATEKERCAKIADVIAEEGKLTTCYWRLRKVAAAIRASNAAPPQPRELTPLERAQKHNCPNLVCTHPEWCRSENNCTGPANPDRGKPKFAAPPHVEPSAAEPWRIIDPSKMVAENFEASRVRLLELARRTEKRPTSGNGRDLAALVIETFGVKK